MKDQRTDEELNRIIAEWHRSTIPDSGVSVAEFGESPPFYPPYCTDLNAIHEAVKNGPPLDVALYEHFLGEITDSPALALRRSFVGERLKLSEATARQRAEALVAVIEQFPKQP